MHGLGNLACRVRQAARCVGAVPDARTRQDLRNSKKWKTNFCLFGTHAAEDPPRSSGFASLAKGFPPFLSPPAQPKQAISTAVGQGLSWRFFLVARSTAIGRPGKGLVAITVEASRACGGEACATAVQITEGCGAARAQGALPTGRRAHNGTLTV